MKVVRPKIDPDPDFFNRLIGYMVMVKKSGAVFL